MKLSQGATRSGFLSVVNCDAIAGLFGNRPNLVGFLAIVLMNPTETKISDATYLKCIRRRLSVSISVLGCCLWATPNRITVVAVLLLGLLLLFYGLKDTSNFRHMPFENNSSVRIGKWIWIALWVLVVNQQNVFGAEQAEVTTNSPFVIYLANPPWFKHVEYVRSRLFVAATEPGKNETRIWANITNVAAIQPSGGYNEELSPAPFGKRPSPGDRRVSGVSEEYFWNAGFNQILLSPTSTGAVEDDPPRIVVQRILSEIARIQNLGLPAIQSNSFQVYTNNRFEAITATGESLEGRIVSASHNRPLEISYKLSSNPADLITVRYNYRSDEEDIPRYFEYCDRRDGKDFMVYTNWLLSVNYGIDNAISNGYPPQMFFTNMLKFTSVDLWSNSIRYSVGPNARLQPVSASDVGPSELPYQPNKRTAYFVISTLVLVSIAFGVGVIRNFLKNKTKER
jgi:hypothetical protein